jgi:hypothetical protein
MHGIFVRAYGWESPLSARRGLAWLRLLCLIHVSKDPSYIPAAARRLALEVQVLVLYEYKRSASLPFQSQFPACYSSFPFDLVSTMILDSLPSELVHMIVTVLCDSEEDLDAQQSILSLCRTNKVCGCLFPRLGMTENAGASCGSQGTSLRTRDTDHSADGQLLRHHRGGCEFGGEISKSEKQSEKSVLPPSSASRR